MSKSKSVKYTHCFHLIAPIAKADTIDANGNFIPASELQRATKGLSGNVLAKDGFDGKPMGVVESISYDNGILNATMKLNKKAKISPNSIFRLECTADIRKARILTNIKVVSVGMVDIKEDAYPIPQVEDLKFRTETAYGRRFPESQYNFISDSNRIRRAKKGK